MIWYHYLFANTWMKFWGYFPLNLKIREYRIWPILSKYCKNWPAFLFFDVFPLKCSRKYEKVKKKNQCSSLVTNPCLPLAAKSIHRALVIARALPCDDSRIAEVFEWQDVSSHLSHRSELVRCTCSQVAVEDCQISLGTAASRKRLLKGEVPPQNKVFFQKNFFAYSYGKITDEYDEKHLVHSSGHLDRQFRPYFKSVGDFGPSQRP